MRLMYDYLVVFSFSKEGYLTQGKGNIQVSLKRKIRNFNDVQNLSNFIGESNKIQKVIIENIIYIGRNWHDSEIKC